MAPFGHIRLAGRIRLRWAFLLEPESRQGELTVHALCCVAALGRYRHRRRPAGKGLHTDIVLNVTSMLVPVHVGAIAPPERFPGGASGGDFPGSPHASSAPPTPSSATPRPPEPLTFASPEVDWAKHGLEPRWLGRETSDCVAAFDPSIFHQRGSDEQNRFLEGAHHRGEVALIVATIGTRTDPLGRKTLPGHGLGLNQSIYVSGIETSVASTKLPIGSEPRLADDLPPVERDLGQRVLSRPPEEWWGLQLVGTTMQPGSGGPAVTYEPEGTLVPILVDGLGVPVVAVWVSPQEDRRVYVAPYGTDPDTVLAWLVSQALPEYVPGALRRVRSPQLADPSLQTTAEAQARAALDDLKARYVADLDRLQGELGAATAKAEPIRYGLLYGTGATLEKATADVLRAAGFKVIDLDEELGRTASADLLVTYGAERRMIEVKAASGSASEKFADSLKRHLSTWPELRPAELINGPGVLVVNHQHRLHPDERTAAVFTRPEFVQALRIVVLSSRRLFDWWAVEDWEAIRTAVLGQTTPPIAANPTVSPKTRRWLFKR